MECSRCGISDQKAMLYDVITKEGVIKMCDKCSRYEDSPVIRKPTVFQLKELERTPTVYERLARAAGIKPDERKIEKPEHLIRQETSLRALVDKNYEEKIKQQAKPRPDLVDNFHWVIMRVRRARKITQKQLAEAIGEPEVAIKKAEEGVLPENNYLLNKIQGYLGINLFRNGGKPIQENPGSFSVSGRVVQTINSERKSSEDLTIADLRKIKEEKEKDKEGKDLSDDEIDKILFRK